MKISTYFPVLIIVFFTSCAVNSINNAKPEPKTFPDVDHSVKYTGLRSSSYGIDPFPAEQGWKYAFDQMQSYFPESESCGIWIIGNVVSGECRLQFPKDEGDTKEYEGITFSSYDKHEEYLDYFDENNIKVFLQVESGKGNIEELISLVLNRYKHHESVIGFGVDIEWYDPNGEAAESGEELMNGDNFFAPVTTELAMRWDKKIKEINPSYRLFLKHWIFNKSIMPQNTDSDIIFISDAQDFKAFNKGNPKAVELALDVMIQEFDLWAQNFRSNDNVRAVGYQIGYDSDRGFWQELLNEPYPKNYVNAILAKIPKDQEVSFFWVDFTLNDVFMDGYDGPGPKVIILPPQPIDLPGLGENFAEGAFATASSVERDDFAYNASMATDNDLNTRWASNETDNEWIQLDLGSSKDIKTIAIFWEDAYAEKYVVELSDDEVNWHEVFSEESSNGNVDMLSISSSGRYLKISTLKRFSEWGNSIYEIGVYGK